MKAAVFLGCFLVSFTFTCGLRAEVNSGSNGSDGALNPTSDLVIDMADHPDGIYHYTSVNIPAGVTVSFIPNAANSPVVWLVQNSCAISGTVDVSGQSTENAIGAVGGPGGWAGGSGGTSPSSGQGPGGGGVSLRYGGAGSYGTQGDSPERGGVAAPAGAIYGNSFLVPLMGGSGSGGHSQFGYNYSTYLAGGGGGGGGAILIAASESIVLNGNIHALGGRANANGAYASGGAVRLFATILSGTGSVSAGGNGNSGGWGRVRFDALENNFGGTVQYAVFTSGFQPIILPIAGQGIQLSVTSLAGVAVPANPLGVQANPDVIIPAQQTNPVQVVVNCTNVPLNTEVTVVVHPANGPDVQAVGLNNVGTLASSTATVFLNMPRGGGIIYARAVTGIGGTASAASPAGLNTRSLAETGWTADGERFAKMEITAALGGSQQIAYITESGKRYALTVE